MTHLPANKSSELCNPSLSIGRWSVGVFVCVVLVCGLRGGFCFQFFWQADSFHRGRLQWLMGFNFSLLGNFCRDTQHFEGGHWYSSCTSYNSPSKHILYHQSRIYWNNKLGKFLPRETFVRWHARFKSSSLLLSLNLSSPVVSSCLSELCIHIHQQEWLELLL